MADRIRCSPLDLVLRVLEEGARGRWDATRLTRKTRRLSDDSARELHRAAGEGK